MTAPKSLPYRHDIAAELGAGIPGRTSIPTQEDDTIMSGVGPEPLDVLLKSFALASVAGLAELLKSNRRISSRAILAAVLYNGMSGTIIALLLYSRLGAEHMALILGVSAFAGIGCISILDLVAALLRSGVSIKLNKPGETDRND